MRRFSRQTDGHAIESSELGVRATLHGPLGERARAAIEESLAGCPGTSFELDLEGASAEDAAIIMNLVARAERSGSRVRLRSPGAPLYERLRGLGPLALERVAPREEPAEDWGPWRVESVLATSRGRVAFARDASGRRVFLKTCPEAPARAWLAKGPHPNLVAVLDIDASRGLVALEPVTGPPLDVVLERSGPPARSTAIAILRDVASALSRLAAPAPALVHGDLKASNVVLAREGRAVLVDLELVREAGSPGALAASEGWAAPERLAGLPASPAEDVYSFGVLASGLLADAAGPLEPLVEACRSEDPAARPTIGAVLEALGATAADDGLACASCGKFVYRRATAPFECILCGGPTRARSTIEVVQKAGEPPALGHDPRARIETAQALLRLGRARDARDLVLDIAGPSRLAAEAAMVRAEALLDLDQPVEARDALDACGGELATSERRAARAAILRARARDAEGDLEGTLAFLARARRTSEADDLLALAAVVEGRALLRRGSLEAARAVLERATEAASDGLSTALAVAEARRTLAVVLAREGAWKRASELAREAHDAAAERGSPLGIVRASRTLAWVLLDEGRPLRAAEPLAVAGALARRVLAPAETAKVALLEGEIALELGRVPSSREAERKTGARFLVLAARAERSVEFATRALQALAGAWDAPAAQVALAEALEAARDARAETAALDAERAALLARLPVEAARAAGVLGRVALARGEVESACRHLERALDRGGGRARRALVLLREDLARAYDAASRRTESEEAREQARALRAFLGDPDARG
ncbi:MAG TPA: protein kinase [Planctomycetota bacterium]|nr:protein kinase [Planctomycetota bacterium]